MQTTGRIIRGPWPFSAREQAAPLSLQRKDGVILETFPDYETAILYRERNELGPEWVLQDARGEPTGDDRLLLLGMVVRDHLMSSWRRAQFDRLLHGDILQLPRTAWDGLQDLSASVADIALEEAGHDGWSARFGQVIRTQGAIDHAWIENEDGTLLDFMADRFHLNPITVFPADERETCGYVENRVDIDMDADGWLLDLPGKILEILPMDEPEPEFSM